MTYLCETIHKTVTNMNDILNFKAQISKLNAPWGESAIKNHEEFVKAYPTVLEYHELFTKPSDAIKYGFIWSNTDEEHSYWQKIYDGLLNAQL